MMNTTIGPSTPGPLRYVRTHTLAAAGGLCLAVAAFAAGALTLSPSSGGAPVQAAPRASAGDFRPVHDDWRYVYYIVATQAEADEIMNTEYELQNVIMGNNGELPHRTILTFVADTPEREHLLQSMMAEVSTEITQFVDTRSSLVPTLDSGEGIAVLDGTAGSFAPAGRRQPLPLPKRSCRAGRISAPCQNSSRLWSSWLRRDAGKYRRAARGNRARRPGSRPPCVQQGRVERRTYNTDATPS
jgi:hypothetical protein